MPFITILFALDLIITGIVGFVATGKEHFTALIPSFIGTLLLVLGLLGINDLQSDERARELAAVDMALLTDELPPQAFADPGFIQFLQMDL